MDEGWVFVDVRTEVEFGGGHPPGSLNVPFMIDAGGRRAPNPDFLGAIEALFEKDTRLILGCAVGPRSTRAGAELASKGFTQLKELDGGWAGWPDSAPSETGQPDDRSWDGLLKRLKE